MKGFSKILKRDTGNRKDFNKGYLLGVYCPQKHLPVLKQKFFDMRNSGSNLKKHKALTQGFLIGLQDRTKARLTQLEQVIQKSKSNEIDRER